MEEKKEAPLSQRASWNNPALNPSLYADLSTNLMNSIDMLIMRHKMMHPGWMSDEDRVKAIRKELGLDK